MSLKGKIKVGDVLSYPTWGGNTYRVLDIREGEVLLKNTEGWQGWAPFPGLPQGVMINGIIAIEYFEGAVAKTAIERKIAFMRKRFEERNNATKDW